MPLSFDSQYYKGESSSPFSPFRIFMIIHGLKTLHRRLERWWSGDTDLPLSWRIWSRFPVPRGGGSHPAETPLPGNSCLS